MVPQTVSPQIQKIIGAPRRDDWDPLPKTGEEWMAVADKTAINTLKALPGLMERTKVKVEKTTIDGARVFIVTPEHITPESQCRVLIRMQGWQRHAFVEQRHEYT